MATYRIDECPCNKEKLYYPCGFLYKNKSYLIDYDRIGHNGSAYYSSWTIFYRVAFYMLKQKSPDLLKMINPYIQKRCGIHDLSEILMDKPKLEVVKEPKYSMVKVTDKKYFRLYIQKYSGNNRTLLKLLCEIGEFPSFFVVEIDPNETVFSAEIPEELTRHKKGKLSMLISGINKSVLSQQELFFAKVNKGFDEKVLIGDVEITDEEERILKSYMKKNVSGLRQGSHISYERVLAFGMVQAAKRSYNESGYWSGFNSYYDVETSGPKQALLNERFKEIAKQYKKRYVFDDRNMSQNYCMHSFVCDHYADKLFELVFAFWRIQLNRSLENRFDDGKDSVDRLMELIESGDSPNVLVHTSRAVKENPSGCKRRVFEILKEIDRCFRNNTRPLVYQGRHRLKALLYEWMNDDSKAFYQEWAMVRSDRSHRGGGEKRITSPQLQVDRYAGCFNVFLPEEILSGSNDENPNWIIQINGCERRVDASVISYSGLCYTEETYSDWIPYESLFSDIRISFSGDSRISFIIPADSIRFLDRNDRVVLLRTQDGYARTDIRSAIAKDETIGVLGKTIVPQEHFGYTLYDFQDDIREGDVLVFGNRPALPVGKPLEEGFFGTGILSGVGARISESKAVPVVTSSELLFFRATEQEYNGARIKVSKYNSQTKLFEMIRLDEAKAFQCQQVRVSHGNNYGYFLDFLQSITDNGIYQIVIDLPGRADPKEYEFCLFREFHYEFIDAPYLFKANGRILLGGCDISLFKDIPSENLDGSSLEFFIDERLSEEKENHIVQGEKLCLKYAFSEEQIVLLNIEIPALYWKFSESGCWNIDHPANVGKARLSDIYIKNNLGPVSFRINDEDIDGQRGSEAVIYKRNIYDDRIDEDSNPTIAAIAVGDKEEKFFLIYTRSIVLDRRIIADSLHNRITGVYDLFRAYDDAQYIVQIFKSDCLDSSPVEVELDQDNRFSIDIESEDVIGAVTVKLFENIPGPEGILDVLPYPLDMKTIDLADLMKLTGKRISLSSIRRKEIASSSLGVKEIAKEYRHCVDVLNRMSAKELERFCNELDESDLIIESWQDGGDEDFWLESSKFEDVIAYRGRFGTKDVILRFNEHENDSQVYMYIQYEGGYGLPWYQCSRKRIVDPDEACQITTRDPSWRDYFQVNDNVYTFNYEIKSGEGHQ